MKVTTHLNKDDELRELPIHCLVDGYKVRDPKQVFPSTITSEFHCHLMTSITLLVVTIHFFIYKR